MDSILNMHECTYFQQIAQVNGGKRLYGNGLIPCTIQEDSQTIWFFVTSKNYQCPFLCATLAMIRN